MVHSAYDSSELISAVPSKISAVESHGSQLLISTSDGSLTIYGPQSSASSSDLQREPYVLERTVKGFSKRTVVAMEVIESRELLLSLSESIAFHKLPSLETFAVITKAQGANAYSWDDQRGLLCFARQKRVCIFKHEGGWGFVEVKDFGVPDTVKSMAWCGENICLGIRREYMIMNSTNGALSEVFPSGRIAPPLVVSLPSGDLLLGKDNIGVFVDQNGKLLQDGMICWSEAPSTLVIQKPYALGLLPRHVEIRSFRVPYPLIQTVGIHNVNSFLKSKNTIVVALDCSVHGLFPVPLGAQIVQLTASGDFEEALNLCKMLPPEDSNLRVAKEQSIHIRYAHYLFENELYDEAMDHFLASQAQITYILSMYPSIVLPKSAAVSKPPKSAAAPEPEKFMDSSVNDPYFSRASSVLSDSSLQSNKNVALESKIMSYNTLMALIKFLQKKRNNIIERAAAEGTEKVVLDAVGDNYAYDSDWSKKSIKTRVNITISSGDREMAAVLDTALLQAMILTGLSSAVVDLLKDFNYCDVKICKDFLQKRNEYFALLELYKCNGMHRKALNLLHWLIEESKSDKPEKELPQIFKPEMITDYLKPLCGTDPILVLEFSMLVLESCPGPTIQLFLSGNIQADLVNSYLKKHAPNMQARYLELMHENENGMSGNLQNEMVQIYLSEVLEWHADLKAEEKWDEKAYSPTRRKLLSILEIISGYNLDDLLKHLPTDALYEERAILLGKMNQHEHALSIYVHKLHVPELALSYCDRVYESTHQHSTKSFSNIYLSLLQIYLNPQRTTRNFEKRITNILSAPNSGNQIKNKSNRLFKKIAEIEGAEEIRISPSSTDSGRSDGDDLDDEADSPIMFNGVLDLLSQRWDKINGAQALKLLPKEIKLQIMNLLPFLSPLLNKSSEAHRNLSVIKSLRENQNLQVKDELYTQRKTVVKITGDTICSLCNKKLGSSAFAVFPNCQTIVHFGCFRDSQSMKAVGKSIRRRNW